jgi:hypothetical protein
LGMLFNPAFKDCPDEALIIAHILGGYGELELLLALCLANVLGDNRKALRVLFRTRGETQRINTADALIASDYERAGLKAEYADALGAIRQSLKMRNSLAHSHWVAVGLTPSYETHGLFYVALGDAALPAERFEYKWMHAEITLLKEMESFCGYARQALMYLEWEWGIRKGTRGHNAIPKPKKRQPPTPRIVEDPDVLRRLPKSL